MPIWVAAGCEAGGPPPASPCPLAVSDAAVWVLDSEVRVDGVFLDHEPTTGSEALVVLYPSGESLRLAVTGTEPDEAAGAPPWRVLLAAAPETLRDLPPAPGHSTEAPSSAVVLWPAPEGTVSRVDTKTLALPPDVGPETVAAALTVETPDGLPHRVLLLSFCCDDRRRAEDCEYTCGEVWQGSGDWVRCSARGH